MNLRDHEIMSTCNINGLSKQQLTRYKFTLFTRTAFIGWAWPLIQFDTWSESVPNAGCLIVKLFWTISCGVYRWNNSEEYGQMDHLNPQTKNTTITTIQSCEYACGISHWGQDKMSDISQTTYSNAFSRMKIYEFRLQCHWILFQRIKLTILHHWFR